MGKMGAHELNYSSDIDLIVFFDPAAPLAPRASSRGRLFVRLTRSLIKLLQERTEDGYVFRVDLRLRPGSRLDPGRRVGCRPRSTTTKASARTGNGPP